MILGKKTLILLRFLFSVISIVSLFGIILAGCLAILKFTENMNTIDTIVNQVSNYSVLDMQSWAGIGTLAGLFIVSYLVFEKTAYLLKPIPRRLYTRVNNLAKTTAELENLLHRINSVRDYVIRLEYRKMMRKYKKAAAKQAKELSKIERYPDGEKIWPDLDYV